MLPMITELKKKTVFLLTFLFLWEAFAFNGTPVSLQTSLYSQIPLYGSSEINNLNNNLNNADIKRVIAGSFVDFNVDLCKYIKFSTGVDVCCDFIWGGDEFFHHLNYSFFAGLKIHPFDAGINFFASYALGQRVDFKKITDAENNGAAFSSWGNGFRLGIEYNILYWKEIAVYPIVGTFYEFFPRGNYLKDNIFAVYAGLQF